MIKSITATNHLGESIKMELRFPEKSGFLIKSIEGLGPSKANINLTELATTDGARFNSAKLTPRNIVIAIKFLDYPSVETNRQLSYKYFPVKKRIRLEIETDNRKCEIYGNVESNEPDIFSSSESTTISIMCPDPFFYSTGANGTNVTVFSGIEPTFEFPFSNESLTENLLTVGEVIINQEKNVYYPGDSEIGVTIHIHAIGDATNVKIYNYWTREVMKINTDRLALLTGSIIKAGDDIIISTVRGDKYIRLLRDGVYTNILNCLDKNADWFTVRKGDNIFAYTADTGSNHLQFRIENKTRYEGV